MDVVSEEEELIIHESKNANKKRKEAPTKIQPKGSTKKLKKE